VFAAVTTDELSSQFETDRSPDASPRRAHDIRAAVPRRHHRHREVIIHAAANSNLAACASRGAVGATAVNAPAALVAAAAAAGADGASIVFFSTDQVDDGSTTRIGALHQDCLPYQLREERST